MTRQIRKEATDYVRSQVKNLGHVPGKDVRAAINKVAAALEEIHEATETCRARHSDSGMAVLVPRPDFDR